MQLFFTWEERMLILDAFILSEIVEKKDKIFNGIESIADRLDQKIHTLRRALPELEAETRMPRELVIERLQLMYLDGEVAMKKHKNADWSPEKLTIKRWTSWSVGSLTYFEVTELGKQRIRKYETMTAQKMKDTLTQR